MVTELPPAVRAMAARGPKWLTWVDNLEGIVRDQLRQWHLRADGSASHGTGSLVVPVRTAAGTAAILKIGFPDEAAEHEHLVLRRWGGDGAVRLMSADPHRRATLQERLWSSDLHTLPDIDACEVVANLYSRLHVPALPQLRTLTSCVEAWLEHFEKLPRSAPIPHRLVSQAIALSRDLTSGPAEPSRVLHGDLHYATVLAADREAWLAIAPKPLSGDPHYDVAPMLWHRWDELTGRVRDGVRHRFYTVIGVAGLDEERARAWVVVRAVHEATLELGRTPRADATRLTRYVALAKAVQD